MKISDFATLFEVDVAVSTTQDVVFRIKRFAFSASDRATNAYISGIKRDAPLLTQTSEGTPCNHTAWSCVMKFLSRLFNSHSESNLTTILERQALQRSMPGQAGALAGARLGFLVR